MIMADICELSDAVSSHGNEQVEEEHVEEEIIQDFVSPDQSWRVNETALMQRHDVSRHVHVDNRAGSSDEPHHENVNEREADDHGNTAGNEPENLDDAFPDDAGVFCLDSEDEVKQKISTYEKNSGTHFIVLKKEKGYSQTEWMFKRLSWSQKSSHTVAIPFDGVPFMHLGQVLLGCHQGKDKNTGIKRKYREKATRRSLCLEDEYRPTKRLLSPSTKKLDCPALISIKKVVKFPGYKVASDSSYGTKRKMFQEIEKAIKEHPGSLEPIVKFYLQIPRVSQHMNHPVGAVYANKLVHPNSRPRYRKMTFREIMEAAKRIGSLINLTPIHRSKTVDQLTGRSVFFKAEMFQKTGSFKIRGALNAILCLNEKNGRVNGVITHSSGNHGQALAYAAQMLNIPCTVVVPDTTPKAKVDAIFSYGAEVVYSKGTQSSRKETCAQVQEEKGYHYVSPYDDFDVIAGQGTLGLELVEQCPDVDAILIPTSGGGLAGGIATAVKGVNDGVKIFCVEPEGKELEKSLRRGKRMWPNPPRSLDTIADAIRTQQLGKLTFPILKEKAEKDVFTVTNQEIVEAMKFSWTRLKLMVEAASATAVAAVLSTKMKEMDPSIKNVAVVLSGGNVDIERLPWDQKL